MIVYQGLISGLLDFNVIMQVMYSVTLRPSNRDHWAMLPWTRRSVFKLSVATQMRPLAARAFSHFWLRLALTLSPVSTSR